MSSSGTAKRINSRSRNSRSNTKPNHHKRSVASTVLVPYFPARQTNPYPVVKPTRLDTKGRAVPWDVCYANAALISLQPEVEDDVSSDTAVALLAVADFSNEWQVVWSNKPAMFFRNMDEVREMMKLVFHIKDPATMGWIYLAMERSNLVRAVDGETVFVTDEDGAYFTVTRDPFLST